MRWPPTDLKLLKEIYRRYYGDFEVFDRKNPTRASKIYVPIDIDVLATHFGVDADIIFGRLYYHLEQKYGFRDQGGFRTYFFMLNSGDDLHCIHFPLLSSILADMRAAQKRFMTSAVLSVIAILVSLVAAYVAFKNGG